MMLGKKMWLWLPLWLVAGIAAHYYEPDMKYHAYVTPWTPCEESPTTRSLAEHLVFTPRLGTQMRVVMCRDSRGRQADKHVCAIAHDTVQTVRTCIVPVDCKLGNMTDWLPHSDSELIKYREIINLPHGGGAPCGQVQTIKKAHTVPGSRWFEGPWSKCFNMYGNNNNVPEIHPFQHVLRSLESSKLPQPISTGWVFTLCGGGTKKRAVICVDKNGKPLLDAQCEYAPPSSEEPCEIPCPRDCKVGEWGKWGPCSPTNEVSLSYCKRHSTLVHSVEVEVGVSTRERRVLEAPTELGVPCPPLQEMRMCYQPFCPNWISKPWGECKDYDRKSCGMGQRTRSVVCEDYKGTVMPSRHCENITKPSNTEDCHVPCSGDRVLSQWSPWSECSRTCMPESLSITDPPMRTRSKHILSYGVKDETWDVAMTENEPCNVHSCISYSWVAMGWLKCKSNESISTKFYKHNKVCYKKSTKDRTMFCVKNPSEVVVPMKCKALRAPEMTTSCTTPCNPLVCLSKEWSEFSPCPMGCGEYQSESVRSPLYNDVPECLPAIKRKACPQPPSCNQAVRWYTGSWSSCIVPPDYPCGSGYRIRSVWCGTAEYQKLNPTYCAGTIMPETSIRCFNIESCDMNQSQKTCATICKDPLKYMDSDSLIPVCDCENVDIRPTTSSSCILYSTREMCGPGYRLVASLCLVDDIHVPMEVCRKFHPSESLYNDMYPEWTIEQCNVPCPIDCQYEQWHEWGPCRSSYNDSRSAMHTRTRKGNYDFSTNGRPCLITSQTSNCTAIRPRWKVGEWQPCSPYANVCGKIIINRTVNCVDHLGTPMPHSECLDYDPMPETSTSCHAACPLDCLLSEWSEWSPCEMSSWGHKRRDRTRVVLRDKVEKSNGTECGHLVESRKCTDTYNWYYGSWSSCVPLGTSDCGEGMKMRDARCIKNDKQFVEDSFCNGTKLPDTSWCYTDCGIDCRMSTWSGWNMTGCTCGSQNSGQMTRYRLPYSSRNRVIGPRVPSGRPSLSILADGVYKAISNMWPVLLRRVIVNQKWPGRNCKNTNEKAPCPLIPCAGAMISASDKCIIGDKNDETEFVQVCGGGTMTLYNQCKVLPDKDNVRNLQLPLKWCHKSLPGHLTTVPLRQIEEECAIACKCNDNSPTLTPWSQWSECNGFVRSRKRTLLPEDSDACHRTELQLSVEWTTCSPYQEDSNRDDRSPAHIFFWIFAFFTCLYSMYYMFRCALMCRRKRNEKKPSSV